MPITKIPRSIKPSQNAIFFGVREWIAAMSSFQCPAVSMGVQIDYIYRLLQ